MAPRTQRAKKKFIKCTVPTCENFNLGKQDIIYNGVSVFTWSCCGRYTNDYNYNMCVIGNFVKSVRFPTAATHNTDSVAPARPKKQLWESKSSLNLLLLRKRQIPLTSTRLGAIFQDV